MRNGFSQRRKDRKEWMRLGYLLNFGEAMMKTGITRTVNDLLPLAIRNGLGDR